MINNVVIQDADIDAELETAQASVEELMSE